MEKGDYGVPGAANNTGGGALALPGVIPGREPTGPREARPDDTGSANEPGIQRRE